MIKKRRWRTRLDGLEILDVLQAIAVLGLHTSRPLKLGPGIHGGPLIAVRPTLDNDRDVCSSSPDKRVVARRHFSLLTPVHVLRNGPVINGERTDFKNRVANAAYTANTFLHRIADGLVVLFL